jgi:hypothetical protein
MILGVNWIINVALSKEKFLQMHAHQVPGGRTFIMATAKAIGQPDALLMDRLSTNSEKEQPLDAYNHFQISQSRVRRPRLARRIRVSGSLLLRPREQLKLRQVQLSSPPSISARSWLKKNSVLISNSSRTYYYGCLTKQSNVVKFLKKKVTS